jgi:hypothetical protein
MFSTRPRTISLAVATAVAATSLAGVAGAQSGYGDSTSAAAAAPAPAPAPSSARSKRKGKKAAKPPVTVSLFSPASGDRVNPTGWFVDLAADYNTGLARTGFTTPQLTGPAGHNNIAPAPGAFGPGHDDKYPGLIVLLSTAKAGRGQNLANLFNLTGVTNTTPSKTQLWSTWLVGAPAFGANVTSVVYVAIAADKNRDGIYNDAPDVVPDSDGDGLIGVRDLKAFGVASNVERHKFSIGG